MRCGFPMAAVDRTDLEWLLDRELVELATSFEGRVFWAGID